MKTSIQHNINKSMVIFRRLSTFVVIFFLFLSALSCDSKSQSGTVYDPVEYLEPREPLPFRFTEDIDTAELRVLDEEFRKYLELFNNTDSDSATLSLLNELLPVAKDKNLIPILLKALDSSKNIDRNALLYQWLMEQAITEIDMQIQNHFFSYIHSPGQNQQSDIPQYARIGDKITFNFEEIAAGESLQIIFHRFLCDSFGVFSRSVIENIEIDSTTKNPFNLTFDHAGLYSITLRMERRLVRYFTLVSALSGSVKYDQNRLLVFAASSDSSIAPPYRIHFISANGEIKTVMSDSSGAASVNHLLSPSESVNYDNLSNSLGIIVQKGNDFTLMEASPSEIPPKESLLFYLHTDKPLYRRSERVHFRGQLYPFGKVKHLPDSVGIQISSLPGNDTIYSKRLAITGDGSFKDSIRLNSSIEQGAYNISISDSFIESRYNTTSTRYRRLPIHNEENNRANQMRFFVEDYKGPSLITSITSKVMIEKGENVEIHLKVKTPSGRKFRNRNGVVTWYLEPLESTLRDDYDSLYLWSAVGRSKISHSSFRLDENGEVTLQYDEFPKNSNSRIYASISIPYGTDSVKIDTAVLYLQNSDLILQCSKHFAGHIDRENEIEISSYSYAGEKVKTAVHCIIISDSNTIIDTLLPASDTTAVIKYEYADTGLLELVLSAVDSERREIQYRGKIFMRDPQKGAISSSYQNSSCYYGDTLKHSTFVPTRTGTALIVLSTDTIEYWETKEIEDNVITSYIPLPKKPGYGTATISTIYPTVKSKNINHGNDVPEYLTHYSNRRIPIVDTTKKLLVKMEAEKSIQSGKKFHGVVQTFTRDSIPVQSFFSVSLIHISLQDTYDSLQRVNRYGFGVKWGVSNGVSTSYSLLNDTILNRYVFSSNRLFEYFAPKENRLSYPLHDLGGTPSKRNLMSLTGKKRKTISRAPRGISNFITQSYWNSRIQTDSTGQANLSFTVPPVKGEWILKLTGSDGGKYLVDYRDTITVE